MEGVLTAFEIPMARYENEDLIGELKKYILSKNLEGIESNVAPLVKRNLLESKFNFFQDDTDIIKRTRLWITNCITKTVNTLQKENTLYDVIFKESWYHITKTNGVHEPHIHPGCSWCGVYYVDSGDEKMGGDTAFNNPVQSTYIDGGNLYLHNMGQYRVKAKSGKLILFPSFLPHYQSLYQGTKDRIVIAFNASVFKREEV